MTAPRPHLPLFLLACGLAFAVSLKIDPAWQLGSQLGLGGGALSGVVALGLTLLASRHTLNAALAAMAGGFLFRMAAVAAALLLAGRMGAEPLAAAVGFFFTYAVSQALEIHLVARTASPGIVVGQAQVAGQEQRA